jgi:hypothetical protein
MSIRSLCVLIFLFVLANPTLVAGQCTVTKYVGNTYFFDSAYQNGFRKKALGYKVILNCGNTTTVYNIEDDGDTASYSISHHGPGVAYHKVSFTPEGEKYCEVTTYLTASSDTVTKTENFFPIRSVFKNTMSKDSILSVVYSCNEVYDSSGIFITDRSSIGRKVVYQVNDSGFREVHSIELAGKLSEKNRLFSDDFMMGNKRASWSVLILDNENRVVEEYSGHDGRWVYRTEFHYLDNGREKRSVTYLLGKGTQERVKERETLKYDGAGNLIEQSSFFWIGQEEKIRRFQGDFMVYEEIRTGNICIQKVIWEVVD